MHYAVLAAVSNCYSPLRGRFLTRYSPVRHCPQLHLTEVLIHRFSFDLHVLSTPPAFILSQDQTLNKLYLNDLSRSNQVIEVSFLNFKDNELTSSLSYCYQFPEGLLKILLVLRLFLFVV